MDKKHHPLDDLFRKGLSDLEIKPSETGRSGFLAEAGRERNNLSRRSGWITGMGIILGLAVVTGAFLVWLNTGEKETARVSVTGNKSNQPVTAAAPGQEEARPANEITKPANALASQNSPSPGSQKTKISPGPVTVKHIADKLQGIKKDDQSHNQASESPVKNISGHTETIPSPVNSQAVDTKALTDADRQAPRVSPAPMAISDNVNTTPSPPSKKAEAKGTGSDSTIFPPENHAKEIAGQHSPTSSYNREWNIRAGIYYIPEWMFNTLDNNKFANNFGLEGEFRYGPYSVRTGIGLSITRGYNEIVIDTKPYLGSYQSLEYITYQWDSRHYHLIPTYYTTLKEVFDTALHKNYYTLEKEYTYLQAPLVLGYDFFKAKWFSLGARVGPVMSVLLKTKELTSQYDAGKDEVISVNDVTPDRVNLNWQAMAGINASFHMSELFIFEVEPEARYYFNSVYEKSSPSSKPWSIGIRCAFLVNF
jgi:hypothetical protein